MFPTLPFLLCLVAASHQFNVTKFSVPPAVELDDNAELACEHDAPGESSIVKWWWTPADGGQKRHLYQRSAIDGRSRQQLVTQKAEPKLNITIKTDGADNLLLWGLKPEHSGSFECEVEEETGDYQERRSSADLVVYTIGNGTQLTYVGEEEVLVTCEATGVAPEPDIVISFNSFTSNSTDIEGPEEGLYNVTTNVTVSRQDIEGAEISCKLSFQDPDIPTYEVSEVYLSDAWLATTAEAPDETTEVPATMTAQLQPNGAARSGVLWVAFVATAIPMYLRAL